MQTACSRSRPALWLSRTLAADHQVHARALAEAPKHKARDWDIVNESDEEELEEEREREQEERRRKRPRSAGGLKAIENLEKKPSPKRNARRARSKDRGSADRSTGSASDAAARRASTTGSTSQSRRSFARSPTAK